MQLRLMWAPMLALAAAGLAAVPLQAQQAGAPALSAADRSLARGVFQELIETNTTDSVGSVSAAAEKMRARLLAGGFAPEDLLLAGPNARKHNLVVRYRGRSGSQLKPILIIGHLDVVEARREDWTTDPFQFIEKEGYFYGRGTQDMKDGDAAMVVTFLRLRRQNYVPDRDLVLALTADEEGGQSNGVDWLLRNKPDWMQAEFVLNPDAGGITARAGKPAEFGLEATEKTYADFRLSAVNRGGHSSLPRPDNAIYQVVDALARLQRTPFPVEVNPITQAFFAETARTETGQIAADMRTVSAGSASPGFAEAAARLSQQPVYNSTLRTTCVATMLNAGHAPNALPQHAQANVNCRILPGHSGEEVRQKLIGIFAEPSVTVEYVTDAGEVLAKAADRVSAPPPPVNPLLQATLKRVVAEMWGPSLPIVPEMEPGASDSIYTTAAGMPSYGLSGFVIDIDDVRAHGQNERLGVESFYKGVEFEYLLLKGLTSSR